MDAQRCASDSKFVSRRGCLHMVFLGNPGTGKTALARLIASLLKQMGLLRRGQLVVAKKSDLLGTYSNHVARNTSRVIQSALGGVLFIDEAYSLLQGEAELGREAINVIVDLCYAHKDDLVVILAGYNDAMAALLGANAGLASRFPHKFHFADYSVGELVQIATLMLESFGFELADQAAAQALQQMMAPIAHELPCGNARSVENRLEAAVAAQSTRLTRQAAERRERDRQVQGQTRRDEDVGLAAHTKRWGSDGAAGGVDARDPSLFTLTAEDIEVATCTVNLANAVLARGDVRTLPLGGHNI